MQQQTNETKNYSEKNESQLMVIPSSHVMPCCTWCGNEMELVEGDVIYGESWYHEYCWESRSQGGKQNV